MTEKPDTEVAPRWRPTDILVIDTNIILSAVLGRRSLPAFEAVSRKRSIATSARVAEEARRVLRGGLSDLPSDALAREEAILGGINVIAAPAYAVFLDRAATVLSDAVASRNGSRSDAHVLACAWLLDADI